MNLIATEGAPDCSIRAARYGEDVIIGIGDGGANGYVIQLNHDQLKSFMSAIAADAAQYQYGRGPYRGPQRA